MQDQTTTDQATKTSYQDETDSKLFAELNAAYPEEDEEEFEELLQQKRKKAPFVRLLAFGLSIVLLAYILGNFFSFINWPALTFLRESQQLKQEALIQELQSAVVAMESFDHGSRNRRATGFNLSPKGLIVTNAHVVQNALGVSITFPGHRRSYHASDWVIHPELDLAVTDLALADATLPTVSANFDGFPEIDEDVLIIGNPLGFPLVAMEGRITNYRGLSSGESIIAEIAAPIHQGSSGSPVFNTHGQVVAVVFATSQDRIEQAPIGFAVPIVYLQDMISDTSGD